MEKINESILAKVQHEASHIISEAEEKALEKISKAEQEAESRFEQEKRRILDEAGREAARILSQAQIETRQELGRAKAEILTRIRNKVEAELAQISSEPDLLIRLAREAIDGLGSGKARLYTSPKDIAAMEKALKADKKLADMVVQVKEDTCLGGVIAESIDEKIRVDNTYNTRLEMLLPRILPEIEKELFEIT